MSELIKLNEIDNVAMARRHLNYGEEGAKAVIPKGHKMALQDIARGDPVIKYAQIIGYASETISEGSHVHVENLEFRNVDQKYEFGTNVTNEKRNIEASTFLGYRRSNGKVGTRNTIAILTSVNCSATAARLIAEHFTCSILKAYPNVDNVTAYVHGTGCGMADSGDGFEALQRVMWGYAKNPNVAAVLMVGLGCEMNQIDWLVEAYGLKVGPLFQTMNIQDFAGLRKTVEMGIKKVSDMLPIVNVNSRSECPASELMVALQCGGSDAWSGITANPALGFACDLLVANGGTGVLAETPEIYGAEHLLTKRTISSQIGKKLIRTLEWWEDYTLRNKGTMDNNPSPGNKKGGLTTILEKSLGAVAKGGTTPLTDVFKYAEEINTKGFVFMDSPGYDPASVTGQIASGCNLVAFTTGRGSAFGSKPSPCIKIATNSTMYERMVEDMDINAGEILTGGMTTEGLGYQIFNKFLRVASGEKTKSESQGLGDYEFVPWQIGAVM
jgi:altronate hydrolase